MDVVALVSDGVDRVEGREVGVRFRFSVGLGVVVLYYFIKSY